MNFYFPFQPYPIQEKFMKELYITVENNKSGIFESPTGTGKSLSICCSALQWLKDYNKKFVCNLENEIEKIKQELKSNDNSEDWLQTEYERIQKNQVLANLQMKLDRIKIYNEKFNDMKVRVEKQKTNTEQKSNECIFHNIDKNRTIVIENKENIDDGAVNEDGDLILEECFDEEIQSDEEDILKDDDCITKIYISSRTHSQLSQFVGEIKRTIFKDNTRLVTLASRQHYCINPNVAKLKNVNLINERCLDMQKSKSKSTSVAEDGKVLKRTKTKSCTACPFYNHTNINKLRERMLCDIMDMEDLVKIGKEIKACPYYASRAALDDAERISSSDDEYIDFVTAVAAAELICSPKQQLRPYFLVLVSHAGIVSEGARSGMSLKLKGNILILDEAHGLTAALENAHCAPVPVRYLESVKTFLKLYINKYSSRLSSKNLLALNQLQFIVGKLLGMINKTNDEKKADDPNIFTLEDFVIKADIDHLNLRKTIEFCKTSKLAPKLHGFAMRYTPEQLEEVSRSSKDKKTSLETFLKNISGKKAETQQPVQQQVPKETKQNIEVHTETSPGTGLYALLDFLQMLCERSEHGRVLAQKGTTDGLLKYLLLNPAEHFLEVVKQCRSVIVAGGTMEPISEFVTLLTGDAKATDTINIVKCDHVVPPDNVVAICLSKGPTNVNLNFTYENRMSEDLLNEIGCILRNVCNLVPGGVVCFLPSYSYEQILFDHLKKKGYLNSIEKRKTVFREPKSAADVDQVLSKYAAAVRSKNGRNGALLLSVVGGKLSEGLNFSDDLGRCVIVFGMPYPNIKSPELQEKMNYLNRSIGPGAGSSYYESLCMKAVNQCIGRAVRHANDYACVLLVDERYSRPYTVSALPSFVQKSLITNCTFGKTIGHIGKFFNKHKENKT